MRIAVLVTSPIKSGLAESIASGRAPRRDYFELQNRFKAELVSTPERGGPIAKVLKRAGGNALAMAWTAWAQRDQYEVVVTDQEGTGLLLALLFKLTRTRRGHVMISHYLTPAKKQVFYRYLKAQTHIDRTVCYGTAQERLAREKLGLGPEDVSLVLHAADSRFWTPATTRRERETDRELLRQAGLDLPDGAFLVASAGLEFRDYSTLIEAARSLPAGTHVAIAASSPWSKRKNTAQVPLPPNVHRLSLTPLPLRALYRRADVVALPLFDVDFQAGSLVAYEAMACGTPVVISRTRGQGEGDIVQEGVTGLYVPPGDAAAMAAALNRLLADPALRERLGRESRAVVERGLNLDAYLDDMARIITDVARRRATNGER